MVLQLYVMACQEAVSLFQSTTGADAETAEHCLEAFEGDLDRAVSHYFDASSPPGAPPPAETTHTASSPPPAINVDLDDEEMAASSAREVRQAASLSEADRAARLEAQRRNQGHLEEEEALQQALAASRMPAGTQIIAYRTTHSHGSVGPCISAHFEQCSIMHLQLEHYNQLQGSCIGWTALQVLDAESSMAR